MRKDELISLVKNTVRRIDKTNSLHERVIEMALGRSLNTVIYDVFRNDMSNMDLYTKTYENVAVSASISELPVSIVQLPRVGDGVMAIRATGEDGMYFYPMTIQQSMNHSFLESTNYTSDVGFVVRNSQVQYYGISDDVTAVDMDLVRPFEEYDMDEDYYVPAGQDETVLRRTLEILGVIQPVNLINNNSDEPNRSQGNRS